MFELLVQLLVDHRKKVAVVELLEDIYSKRLTSGGDVEEVVACIEDAADDVFELEEILHDMIGER